MSGGSASAGPRGGAVAAGLIGGLVLGGLAAAAATPAYAYPYGAGWTPGTGFYDLPYDRTEVEGMQPFDEDRLAED